MSYFVKLPLDYFDGLAVKKMRKAENGDTLLLVYLKIVLHGVQGGGVITYEGVFDTPEEEIAERISEDPKTVSAVVRYCMENRLAEKVSSEEVQGYRFFDSITLTESKGESTERVRKYRERNKLLQRVTETDGNACVTSSSTHLYSDNKSHSLEQDTKSTESKRNGAARFVPPTVGEVADFIKEKGYHLDAEQFVAFYTSKGWKVGAQPMKDWKASCATWEKRRNVEMRSNDPTQKTKDAYAAIEAWAESGSE